MRVSVFGLGYVGCVTAACLARDGFEVIGVDVNPEKVHAVERGRAPVAEPHVGEMLVHALGAGCLRATTDPRTAVLESDVSLVCVGTPPSVKGDLDLSHVFAVMDEIGAASAHKAQPHVVILRSTVPPGTTARCRDRLRAAAPNGTPSIAFNPEFLRESTAVADYDDPPFVIIGADDDVAETAVRRLYASVQAPTYVTDFAAAELVKFVCNAWHATKVSFGNEVGRLAKAYGADGRRVMDLVTKDVKLNVSPVYLRPGSAYGGSCLPKDLGALIRLAHVRDVSVPMLRAIPRSNTAQVSQVVQAVLRGGTRRVAVLGLAFKARTDDLRGSPAVAITKQLLAEGCDVRVYDPLVRAGRLTGANLHYIRNNLPHFERLLVAAPEDALADAQVAVLMHLGDDMRATLTQLGEGIRVVDAVGLVAGTPPVRDYDGVGW